MQIFVYGFTEQDMETLHGIFGMHKYIDVTAQYQDILALNADIVVVNLEKCEADVLDVIRYYESETKDEEKREYYYVSRAWLSEWKSSMREKLKG